MKVKTSILDKVAILLFLVLLTMASLCFGGNNPAQQQIKATTETQCKLISFSATKDGMKMQINWEAQSSLSNYYFIIKKTSNGTDYIIADFRKGSVSASDETFVYSFTDDNSEDDGISQYVIELHEMKGMLGDDKILVLQKENLFENETKAIVNLEATSTLSK